MTFSHQSLIIFLSTLFTNFRFVYFLFFPWSGTVCLKFFNKGSILDEMVDEMSAYKSSKKIPFSDSKVSIFFFFFEKVTSFLMCCVFLFEFTELSFDFRCMRRWLWALSDEVKNWRRIREKVGSTTGLEILNRFFTLKVKCLK